jgi:hypothetical protein
VKIIIIVGEMSRFVVGWVLEDDTKIQSPDEVGGDLKEDVVGSQEVERLLVCAIGGRGGSGA